MNRSAEQLRSDALKIWLAGLEAVRSPRLVFEAVAVEEGVLRAEDYEFNLAQFDRIVVVGGGKAAAGMSAAVEQSLGPRLIAEKQLDGIVVVPEGCAAQTDRIRLHPGRPAGVNEPTAAGAVGALEALRLVESLNPRDLCICLLSGGGSALLPAPINGLSLTEKAALTREMSARGATIQQMNAVRRELSQIKGGGLARRCRAGQLLSLVISDVPGDDLSLVASGPTVLRHPSPEQALEVLRALGLEGHAAAHQARTLLERAAGSMAAQQSPAAAFSKLEGVNSHGCRISHVLLGNNATAVDAAGIEAERLGYSHAMIAANEPEGDAEAVAERLAEMAARMREEDGPDCLISGGEPTVQLAPADLRGRGGRNQQLCLAALAQQSDWQGLALISGGTDGEDGPTDAAGACVDQAISEEANRRGLDPQAYLQRNDAYAFFQKTGGLLMTGPTHTNVCDLRVITVSR